MKKVSKIITTTGKVNIQDDQDSCVMMFDYEYQNSSNSKIIYEGLKCI